MGSKGGKKGVRTEEGVFSACLGEVVAGQKKKGRNEMRLRSV